MLKDYLTLHFLVFLWGFTAILGLLISLPAVELVIYRTLLATVGVGALLAWHKVDWRLSGRATLGLLANGGLIALHWILFFASARVANASVCLAGMATTSLWASLIGPLLTQKSVKWYEVLIGAVVMAGLYLIFHFQFNQVVGLLMAVGSAFLGALFTVLNSQWTQKYHHYTITMYEMAGACLTALLFLPIYQATLAEGGQLHLVPIGTDWPYLGILALVCTVYAFSVSVELMKRISAYTVNLTVNLEPVYGMVLAALFFNEHQYLHPGFYGGAVVILIAVLAYPLIKKWDDKRALSN